MKIQTVRQVKILTPLQMNGLQFFVEGLQRQLKTHLHGVVLFGSTARGDRKRGSDIDLLVLVNKLPHHQKDIVYQHLVEEELQWNSNLSPKVYDWKEYQKNKLLGTPFTMEVERDGILLAA